MGVDGAGVSPHKELAGEAGRLPCVVHTTAVCIQQIGSWLWGALVWRSAAALRGSWLSLFVRSGVRLGAKAARASHIRRISASCIRCDWSPVVDGIMAGRRVSTVQAFTEWRGPRIYRQRSATGIQACCRCGQTSLLQIWAYKSVAEMGQRTQSAFPTDVFNSCNAWSHDLTGPLTRRCILQVTLSELATWCLYRHAAN